MSTGGHAREDERVLAELYRLYRRRTTGGPQAAHCATAAELARALGWTEGEAFQSLSRLALLDLVVRVPTGALPRQSPYRLTAAGAARVERAG